MEKLFAHQKTRNDGWANDGDSGRGYEGAREPGQTLKISASHGICMAENLLLNHSPDTQKRSPIST